jgi:hypothetical protein
VIHANTGGSSYGAMSEVRHAWIATIAVGVLLIAPARGERKPTPPSTAKPPPSCAPFAGTWSGVFDGGVSGSWAANVEQSGTRATAAARASVKGIGELLATGDAEVICKGGVTNIAGTGTASGRSGSFWGTIDRSGSKVSGTWAAGRASGTWRGTREKSQRRP